MLIDYEFPTPLEAPTSLQRATDLLIPLGFVVMPIDTASLPKGHFAIELRRGFKWHISTDVRHWLHAVRIEWDENRVNVMASLPPSKNHTSTQAGKLSAWQANAIQRMLTELAESIEKLLDGRFEADAARASVETMELQIAAEAQRQGGRRVLAVVAVLGMVVAALAAVIYLRH